MKKGSKKKREKKPLIIHIITKLELGGAQRVTLDTLKNLDKAGFRTGLISGAEGELTEEATSLKDCDVRLLKVFKHPIKPLHDILAFIAITIILLKTKPAVVHTHSSKAGIIGRWAAFFVRVPVRIHSVHGWSFNDYQKRTKRILYTFLEKITSPITSYYLLESKKHIEIGKRKKILKENNYELLPPGIDFSELDRLSSKQTPPAPHPIDRLKKTGNRIVTMIACFKPQKAPLDFVRAAAVILKKIESIKFILVGDGILRDQIESEIENLDLKKDVILTGWRRDTAEIIVSSDCIVLTSLWEGMPTVLPMAMRVGTPAVANRIDGCAELIENGKNGLLSEPGNPGSTADNIIKVLTDSSLEKKIKKNGYKYTKEFEITRTTKKQEDIYSKLIGKLREFKIES